MRTLSVRRRSLASRGTDSLVLASACLLAWSGVALAQEAQAAAPEAAPVAPAAQETAPVAPVAPEAVPAPAAAEPPAPALEEAPKPAPAKPPPYSLPWQLRPVAPGNVVRLDSSYGFYKSPTTSKSGSALVSTLLGSYKILPDLALIGRVGLVANSPPEAPQPAAQSATSMLNPVIAGLYGIKLSPSFKLGLFLGVTVPVGTGGGTIQSQGDRDRAAANGAGIATRSAFDNAMFAVNYLTVFPGVDFAYVHGGFTAQVEATIFKLTKVRGPDTIDHTNTNFTTGLHVGYFVIPMLSIGAELRHQRWLSTPNGLKSPARDTTTVAFGPRLHFKLSDSIWFRPGVSLSLPIDDPLKASEYKIVQLDLPVAF